MRFQMLHPDLNVNEWLELDASALKSLVTLNNLLEEKVVADNKALIQTSITSLTKNKKPQIINLGRFRIDIEDVTKIDFIIKALKNSLKTLDNKK